MTAPHAEEPAAPIGSDVLPARDKPHPANMRIPRPRDFGEPTPLQQAGLAQSEVRFVPSLEVAEAELATPVEVDAAPIGVRRLVHKPRLLLGIRVCWVLVAGLSAAQIVDADRLVASAVLLFSLVLKYHAGPSAIRPGLPRLREIASDVALPISAVAVSAAYSKVPDSNLRDAIWIIAVVNVADLAATLVKRRFESPIRIVIVGDRDAIAKAATRWSGHPRAVIVGGLLPSKDMDHKRAVSTTHGIRTIRGIDEVRRWVEHWAADMVVVFPGPGVTSDDLRTLSWSLETTDAAMAVTGILDSVAPHRIDTTTTLAGITLIQTRSSRPSRFIRGVKWTVDRLAGIPLLIIAKPFLMLCSVCIRLESPGRAFFRQGRVGKDGRLFTMYKLRTMHADSETKLAILSEADEGNGVLCKIRRDPRVTRLGRSLNKTSMDELPN